MTGPKKIYLVTDWRTSSKLLDIILRGVKNWNKGHIWPSGLDLDAKYDYWILFVVKSAGNNSFWPNLLFCKIVVVYLIEAVVPAPWDEGLNVPGAMAARPSAVISSARRNDNKSIFRGNSEWRLEQNPLGASRFTWEAGKHANSSCLS